MPYNQNTASLVHMLSTHCHESWCLTLSIIPALLVAFLLRECDPASPFLRKFYICFMHPLRFLWKLNIAVYRTFFFNRWSWFHTRSIKLPRRPVFIFYETISLKRFFRILEASSSPFNNARIFFRPQGLYFCTESNLSFLLVSLALSLLCL